MTTTNPFDPALFGDDAISAETKAINEGLIKLLTGAPEWWNVGAEVARQARRRGEGAFPAPVFSDKARNIEIEGKGSHKIPLRIIAPENPTGVYLHIHGGGWVFGAFDLQDLLLERIVKNTGMACVSVEYRLAPEHPYPAGPDDCETAAVWLVKNAKSEFGTETLTIGGESAGAQLSAVTLLRLRDRHGYTGFKGANLVYGAFDMGMTPSQRAFGNDRLVLRTLDIEKFSEAFLANGEDRSDPDISPLYARLHDMPPALFTIGTRDALMDDSFFMHARWAAAGNEAVLDVYPGGAHGFNAFPGKLAQDANEAQDKFLARMIGKA